MKKSIFTQTRGFKKTSNSNISYRVMTESKYPDYLVPYAYDSLKFSQNQISIRHLDLSGIRRKYILKLLIIKKELYLFNTPDFLNEILNFYLQNPIDTFITDNIYNYTKTNLSNETKGDFINLWRLVPEKFTHLFLNESIKNDIEKEFIEIICIPSQEFIRFYAGNNLFSKFCIFDPLFQIYQVVKFLSSVDIEDKFKIISNGIHCAFEKIIRCNLEIFDCKKSINFITKKIHYKKLELTKENINAIYCSYDFVDTDNLDIRKILYFFRHKIIEHPWHSYFVLDCNIKSYDDHFILFNLFNIKNYTCIFDKNDCIAVESDFKKMQDKIFDLYNLSRLNPSFKVFLKLEIEKLFFIEKEVNIFLKYKKLPYSIDIEDHILDMFLYKNLIIIGYSHFNQLYCKYLKENEETFLSVYLFYLKNDQIHDDLLTSYHKKSLLRLLNDFEKLEVKIEELVIDNKHSCELYYNSMDIRNKKHELADINQKIIIACLFEILSYTDFYTFDAYINFLYLFNPEIILKTEPDLIITHCGGIKETIHYFIKSRYKSIYIENNNYIKNTAELLQITHSNSNYVYTESYLDAIKKIFLFSIDKDNLMTRICKTIRLEKSDVINHDSFILSLLFDNKLISSLINTFYLSKDIEIKFYMPKFWNIYFMRNKIENIESFVQNSKTQINIMHIICILTSLFNEGNKDFCFKYIRSIKNMSQEIVFFKFLFVFYHLKVSGIRHIFDDLLPIASSNDCKFIASVINGFYHENKDTPQINKLIEDIRNCQQNTEYENLGIIFSNKDISKRPLTVFEYSRQCNSANDYEYIDKSGTMKMVYQLSSIDPEFVILFFTQFDKIEKYDWNFLIPLITKGLYIPSIIELFLKHKALMNNEILWDKLKTTNEFYTNKIVNTLSKEEIICKANNIEYTDLEFYKHLENVNLFSILENEFVYVSNHYQILDEFVRLHEFKTVKSELECVQKNFYYCMLVRLSIDDNLMLFLNNFQDVYEVPFDYEKFRTEKMIRDLVNAYLKNLEPKILKLIRSILGNNKYFLPIFEEIFPQLKYLQKYGL